MKAKLFRRLAGVTFMLRRCLLAWVQYRFVDSHILEWKQLSAKKRVTSFFYPMITLATRISGDFLPSLFSRKSADRSLEVNGIPLYKHWLGTDIMQAMSSPKRSSTPK